MSRHNPERVRTWRDLIDVWKRSGRTINAFCRDRKLTRSNFDRWRQILARNPSESSHGESSSSPSSAFVPLRVVAEPMAEVVLPSGILLRLPLNAAPEAITRLLAAVGAASC
jgi:transposase